MATVAQVMDNTAIWEAFSRSRGGDEVSSFRTKQFLMYTVSTIGLKLKPTSPLAGLSCRNEWLAMSVTWLTFDTLGMDVHPNYQAHRAHESPSEAPHVLKQPL